MQGQGNMVNMSIFRHDASLMTGHLKILQPKMSNIKII